MSLERPITLAFGTSRDAKIWRNEQRGTLAEFLSSLLSPDAANFDKDGVAFLQGSLRPGASERTAKNMSMMEVVAFDVESGEPPEPILERARQLGLCCVIYPTHSYGKTETRILTEVVQKHAKIGIHDEPSAAQVLTYWSNVKGIVPTLVEKAVVNGRDGFEIVVEHPAFPRFRAVVPLSEPVDVAAIATSLPGLKQYWKAFYEHLATALGIQHIDPSCSDVSRLFFLHRRPKGAEPWSLHVDGAGVDFGETLKEAKKGPKTAALCGPRDSVKKAEPFKTPGLSKFLKEHGHDFEAAEWLRSSFPDDVRHDYGNKIEFRCPNEDNHTEQKADDRGFAVWDASASDSGGFHMGCLHAGCIEASGKDRAWYLDRLCVYYQVGIEALLEFCPQLEADAAADEKDQATLAALINSLSPESTPDEIAAVVAAIARSGKSKIIKEALLRSAAERVDGKWSARIEAKWRRWLKDAENDTETGEKQPLRDGAIYAHVDFKEQLEKAKELFADRNKTPYIFSREEGGQFRAFEHDGKIRLEEITGNRAAWHDELNDVADFRRITNKHGDLGVPPFPDVITAFIGTTRLNLPILDQVTYFPIFDADGKLCTEKGYDRGTRFYLDPKLVPTLAGHPIPTEPSDADVASALEWITESVFDVPFVDKFGEVETEPQYVIDSGGHRVPNRKRGAASFEHWLAMGLQMIMRNMICGPCPSIHVAKPEVGTGGSLVVKIIHNIFTGDDPGDIPLSSVGEELRKTITSLLRCGGSNLLFFDNIKPGHIDIPFIAQLVTSGVWRDRILGQSEIATIPFRQQVVLCGNRLGFTKEMIRRNVPIGLNAYTPNPAMDRPAGSYRHPDLLKWVRENQANLAGAFYTLAMRGVRAGVLTGRVTPVRTLASFDSWSQVIGGTLAACGLTDFLGNRQSYAGDVETEDVEDVWSEIVQCLWKRRGTEPFSRDEIELADRFGVAFKRGGTDKASETSAGMLIRHNLTDKTFVVSGPGEAVVRVSFECVKDKRPRLYQLTRL